MESPALQQEARALGDPTRHRIFRYVVEADRPVDVVELTEHFGLNHNAIRQHLAKLVETELVIESTAARKGPGRPRLCYTLSPTTHSRWGVTGPYERLALMLSEIIRTGDSPVDVGRRAGRRGRLGGTSVHDPVGGLAGEMARTGFDPMVRNRGGRFEIVLRECPFVSAAITDPDTVCGLHLGIAYGLADMLGDLVIDELVPKDPRRANCILRCHTAAAT